MMHLGKMLGQVLHSAGRKPATVLYPFEPAYVPDRFRGRLEFFPEKCIGCKMCVRDCPAWAIGINKVADKQFEAVIAVDRCIACGQCVDSCPKDALALTTDFELAQVDHAKLRTVTRAKPSPPPEAAATPPPAA